MQISEVDAKRFLMRAGVSPAAVTELTPCVVKRDMDAGLRTLKKHYPDDDERGDIIGIIRRHYAELDYSTKQLLRNKS